MIELDKLFHHCFNESFSQKSLQRHNSRKSTANHQFIMKKKTVSISVRRSSLKYRVTQQSHWVCCGCITEKLCKKDLYEITSSSQVSYHEVNHLD